MVCFFFSGRNANDTELSLLHFVYRFCYLFIKNHKKRCLSIYSARFFFLVWVRCIFSLNNIWCFELLRNSYPPFTSKIHISTRYAWYCCSVPTFSNSYVPSFPILCELLEWCCRQTRFDVWVRKKTEGSRMREINGFFAFVFSSIRFISLLHCLDIHFICTMFSFNNE